MEYNRVFIVYFQYILMQANNQKPAKDYRLKVSFLGALLRAFGITFLLFMLSSFLLFTGLAPAILIFLLVVFVAVFAYYLAFRWYSPAFPLRVGVVELATPKRVKLVRFEGEPREEKEFKLEELRPSLIDLKGYIHTKSNRNVLITGSSGQGKSKLTRHLLGLMAYQKLIFSFKPGEEYHDLLPRLKAWVSSAVN